MSTPQEMQDAKITTDDVPQPDPTSVTPVPWFQSKGGWSFEN